MIAYRATLDVPRELVRVRSAKLLAAERRRRGTPAGSRALTCFWEAVLALRWFRDRTSPGALARDHGISRATGYRYLDEVIEVLAEQAPDLREALERAKDQGFAHVILDGKIIPADRCKEPAVSVKGQLIDLWYSGKAHCHGGNIQAVLAPDGFPLWISDVEPGSVHRPDRRPRPRPARSHTRPPPPECLPWPTWATTAPASAVHLPVKQPADGRDLDINTRTRTAPPARRCRRTRVRPAQPAPCRWRTLQHITASSSKLSVHRPRGRGRISESMATSNEIPPAVDRDLGWGPWTWSGHRGDHRGLCRLSMTVRWPLATA